MDAMRIGGIQKHCALNLLRGLQIAAGPNEGELEVAHLTPSWVMKHFTLSERFKAGSETSMSRRDMRRGEQRAVALALEPDHLHVDIRWQGQLPAGRVEERYVINSSGQLEVHSVMQIEGHQAIPIRMVYNRAEGKVHIEG
ncbi:hypothetical protein COHA_003268 [Chlorella ohadii]|uniref:Uncharacterized protein n=1 Tax=Chlorella ohadii TaxID=2649997 RepID=A0AAD5H832_9CHLO|nr:hypothetical protein COHA_003268 [Chlorella ohadii]